MSSDSEVYTCPVKGCDRRIQRDWLMCSQHWYRVPMKLRRDVTNSWNERLRALEGRNGPYDHAADVHERAKAAAIRAVEEGIGVG